MQRIWRTLLLLVPMFSFSGCCNQQCIEHSNLPSEISALGYCDELAAQIEYPDVARPSFEERIHSLPPRQLSDGVPETYWVLTLDEVVKYGMQNSDVLREIGGRVLDFPSAMTSVYDPSITMSHPRLGEEAALSAFDAQFGQQFTAAESSNVFNNATLGGGATEVNQDLFRIQTEIQKTSATGAQYTLRNLVEHDHSDAPSNLLSHAWNGSFEASVRQPLLQGAGTLFNRVAGPNGSVDISLTRGVILARIDGDISIAQFEKGVRDYVRQVENSYWQLYSSYRSLDANRRARDLARATWQSVKARSDASLQGGEADVEAQAREQLYLFEQLVVNALTGGGQAGGVYQAERQLRQLLGLSVNDGRLIRPADEPTDAPVRFDWDACMADAMSRRVELRQQLWRIKQRELELLAARNFLLPRLDAVATYRVAGFGDDLIGGTGAFNSLFREMTPFDNDELEVGLQLNVPIGYRQQFAGVRHAELNLSRERAILREQEHAITHGLADAVSGLEASYESIRLAYNRLVAAEEVAKSREAKFEAGKTAIQDLLEAQRRLADAETNYYQSRVTYAAAITSIHFEKGTLLGYNGVQLSEGAWCDRACLDHRREQFRHKYVEEDYRTVSPVVSQGPVDQVFTNQHVMAPMDAVPDPSVMLTPHENQSVIPSATNNAGFDGFYDPSTLPTYEAPAVNLPRRLPTSL